MNEKLDELMEASREYYSTVGTSSGVLDPLINELEARGAEMADIIAALDLGRELAGCARGN